MVNFKGSLQRTNQKSSIYSQLFGRVHGFMESWRSHVPKNVENAKNRKRVNTRKCENRKCENAQIRKSAIRGTQNRTRINYDEWKLEMEVDIEPAMQLKAYITAKWSAYRHLIASI